jgi:hypothetical protein
MANLFDPSKSSFVCAAPVGAGDGWVVMAMDDLAEQEIEHSAILRYRDGVFEATCLKMFRSKSALWLPGRGEALFVGDTGECTAIGLDGVDRDEFVTASSRSPRNTGHIRSATAIDDEVIAVGMQRQVYRRDAAGKWADMMAGMAAPVGETTGLECVLAVTPSEIYAAGWRGEIWISDGVAWTRVGSPTNQIITSLGLASDGSVIACGRKGLLLRGRRDSWSTLHQGVCPDDLWSIRTAFGATYAAGLRRLYRVDERDVTLVDTGAADARSYGFLAANAGVLWSLGEKDFVEFDGSAWRRVA